jgi:hypothetical protein
MKVVLKNSAEYRDFLGANFEDNAGYSANRERRFEQGVQALSDLGDDLALDLDDKLFGEDELAYLGLLRNYTRTA